MNPDSSGDIECTLISNATLEKQEMIETANAQQRILQYNPSVNFNLSPTTNASTQVATSKPNRSKRTVTFKPGNPTPTPKTKTGHSLLRRAAQNAASFTGKYLFGSHTTPSAVLPPILPPIPTHRDELYSQGEPSVVSIWALTLR